jgi:hypothetical protein
MKSLKTILISFAAALSLLPLYLLLVAPAAAQDDPDLVSRITALQVACVASGQPCEVELDAKGYSINRPIDICTPIRIVGKGVGFTNGATTIYTKRTTAIRTWLKGSCPIPGFPSKYTSGSLVLENVTLANTQILPLNGEIPNEAPFYGIEQYTRVSLTNVGIRGFVQGIRVNCGVPVSNCNASNYTNVDVDSSEDAGIYTKGSDANAMNFTRVRSDGACRSYKKWSSIRLPYCGAYPAPPCDDEYYSCAGIIETSFLGNTYTGSSTSSENKHAGTIATGPVNQSTIVGHYIEMDSQPGWVGPKVTVIGGVNVFKGLGGQLHAANMPGLSIQGGSSAGVQFGQESNVANTVMTMHNGVTGAKPWRLKVNPTTGDLYMDVGNLAPVRGYMPYSYSLPQTDSSILTIPAP